MKTRQSLVLCARIHWSIGVALLVASQRGNAQGLEHQEIDRADFESIVVDGAWLGILREVEYKAFKAVLEVIPIEESGTNLIRGPATAVMPVTRPVRQPTHAAALRLSESSWAVACDTHGGGTRVLQYAVIDKDIAGSIPSSSPLRTEAPDRIRDVGITGPSGRIRFVDLICPQLTEFDEKVYIVASATVGEGVGTTGITWIAEANVKERSMEARLIGPGVDARIARSGEYLYCAVRLVRPGHLADPAPVSLYRSKDLVEWEGVTPPPADWTVSQYDLLFSGDLWLWGVRADAQGSRGELLREIPGRSDWVLERTTALPARGDISEARLVVQPSSRTPSTIFLMRSGEVER